jgi:pantoate--beta-alanine ligase
MRQIGTVAELRAELAPARRSGRQIGLVPTMGALHAGHISLMDRAREHSEILVVSLFVNPTQFNEQADLEGYPRQLERDRELAEQAGADVLFAPSVAEAYPTGFATEVRVLGITERLEGAARGASHFHGVSTVVCKLLCMTQPDVAYFGQKDAQQVLVIRRMVEDLNIPVRIEMCPTVRESDGLAMSSRNVRLSAEQRDRARGLYTALTAAAKVLAGGEDTGEDLLAAAAAELSRFAIEPEYLALVDPQTLDPLERVEGPALLAVAARFGETRLIDNLMLNPVPGSPHDSREREATTRCSV